MPSRPISEVIATRSYVAVPETTSVREVAESMRSHRTSALLVVDKRGRLAGICTERDVVFDVVAEGRDPGQTPVSAIMTAEPRTISDDKPFCHALHMMFEGGFRHVPVVDDRGRPIGLLAAADALECDALQFEEDLIRREELTVVL